jgi:peptide/nickel transport system substrate-binding protein
MNPRSIAEAISRIVSVIVIVAILIVATTAGVLLIGNHSRLTSSPSSTSSSTGGTTYRSTIIVGTTDSITNLDPATAVGYFADNLINNVGSGLVKYQPVTGNIEPDLATNWTISPDGLTYIFSLRSGLKFSNGDPLTAQTIAQSWKRVSDINGPPAFLLTSYINFSDPSAIQTPSNTTLVVHLMAPFSPFLSILALSGAPAYPVDPKIVNMTGSFSGPFVGSGPYMITSWTPGVELDLKANPYYYGTPPLTQNIQIKFFSDSSTLSLALQSKSIDVAFDALNPSDVQTLSANPNVKVIEGEGAVMRYIAFNNKIAPYNNTLLRHALTYAINRTTIIDSVFLGTVSPAYSIVPAGIFGHTDIYATLYGADGNLTKAKQILSQLGYSSSNKLQMDLWYTPTHYGTTEQSVVTVLQQEFEATGMISVTLHSAEYSTYTSLYLGKVNLPVLMLGWFPDYIDADDYLSVMYNSHISIYTGTFYNNTQVNSLLAQEEATNNATLRLSLLQEIQNITAQDDPSVPLWQAKQIAAALPNVSGIVLDVSQIFRFWTLQETV